MPMSKRARVTFAVVFVIFGVLFTLLMNSLGVWNNASDIRDGDVSIVEVVAGDCDTTWGGRWFGDNPQNCYVADLTSPDARQAYGNAGSACALAWWAGGPAGCGWAAVGSLMGSIPWDGTWD